MTRRQIRKGTIKNAFDLHTLVVVVVVVFVVIMGCLRAVYSKTSESMYFPVRNIKAFETLVDYCWMMGCRLLAAWFCSYF